MISILFAFTNSFYYVRFSQIWCKWITIFIEYWLYHISKNGVVPKTYGCRVPSYSSSRKEIFRFRGSECRSSRVLLMLYPCEWRPAWNIRKNNHSGRFSSLVAYRYRNAMFISIWTFRHYVVHRGYPCVDGPLDPCYIFECSQYREHPARANTSRFPR